MYRHKDRTWAFYQILDSGVNGTLPTWATYNSLINESVAVTSCQGLPLYKSSPTDWSTLYSALKMIQGINIEVTGEQKTIISLDLQLYSKCMQLRCKPEIKNNFVFRLGELHIVFAMLKVLGKYIDDSGLDKLFIEAGVYGSTTLRQILEGRHVKRGAEAHVTMYVALSRIYFLDWYHQHKKECSEDIDEIEQELSYFTNLSSDKVDDIKNTSTRLIHTIQDSGILKKLQNFGDSLNGQG